MHMVSDAAAHLLAFADTYGHAAQVYMRANSIDGWLYLLIALTGLGMGWSAPAPTHDRIGPRIVFGLVFAEAVSLDSNLYRAALSHNPHWTVQFWVVFSLSLTLCLAGALGSILARRYKARLTLIRTTRWVRRGHQTPP